MNCHILRFKVRGEKKETKHLKNEMGSFQDAFNVTFIWQKRHKSEYLLALLWIKKKRLKKILE